MHVVLRGAHKIDTGKFELVVMLALAALSFVGASAYIIFAGAGLLLLSTFHEYAHLQPRLARASATRLLAGAVATAVGMSVAFASFCFGIGRFFAWLIAN
jgi:hypothetical protein